MSHNQIRRTPAALEERPFDLLVVGGGIYGAWTAWDAALRGLRVAIIDKGDWGSGTSSATSKLIHGGVRYLEGFHFGLVRKTLRERGRLARLAPHRVLPLRFLVPVYNESPVGPLRLRAGLWLYDRLAGGTQPVGGAAKLGRQAVIDRYPMLNPDGLRCGFTYGDCQMDDFRFALELVFAAASAGAVAVNYAEATAILTEGRRAIGATVRDAVTGQTMEVRASVVVNAAGPWASTIRVDGLEPIPVRLVKGVHLVLPPLGTSDAMLLPGRDGRVVFVIPWYGKTLLGTTDTDISGSPDAARVEESDIDYLLGEANRVLGSSWDRSVVIGRFAGVRALQARSGPPASITREWRLEEPAERLLISTGGKYTSARADATSLVDRATELLGRPAVPSPTAARRLPWSPGGPFDTWLEDSTRSGTAVGLDADTARWSALRFGTLVDRIHGLVAEDRALAERIAPDLPFSMAELVHAARDEMALTLEDLLRRRVPALILTKVSRSMLDAVAAAVAPTLAWSPQRRDEEVETVLARWGSE